MSQLANLAILPPLALDITLPWQDDLLQEQRFKRILKRSVICFLLLLLFFSLLPILQLDLEKDSELIKTQVLLEPELIPEPKVVPKNPPTKEIPIPPPKAVTQKKELSKTQSKPIEQPEITVPAKQKPKKKPPTAKKSTAASQHESVKNLAAQFDQLNFSVDLTKVTNKNVTSSKVGSVAKESVSQIGNAVMNKKSQGLEVADEAFLQQSGVALAMHQATELDGFVAAGSSGAAGNLNQAYRSSLSSQRTDESIRRVFESGKSRAYLHYLKALRSKPGLLGTMVFKLVIEPEGHISALELVSSELRSPALEKKILQEIQKLHFGKADVAPRNLIYKFNFLPN